MSESGRELIDIPTTVSGGVVLIRLFMLSMRAQCAVDQGVAVMNVDGKAMDQFLLGCGRGYELLGEVI
ncbi:hypothetical protein RA267_28745, partial [Pseudomonas syringae pv. tagetis]|uniref:hypothetical protein n=1 Tax=Pseudomonas syringae group genomosp. 7 TaxID=251699 RepID=UPI00376F62BD